MAKKKRDRDVVDPIDPIDEERAANKRHRLKIEEDIVNDVQHIANAEGMALDHGCIESIIMHINKGHVRHVTINY